MSKHGLEGVSMFLLFGDIRKSSQFAVYMHQNGSDGYLFSLFLWVLELK